MTDREHAMVTYLEAVRIHKQAVDQARLASNTASVARSLKDCMFFAVLKHIPDGAGQEVAEELLEKLNWEALVWCTYGNTEPHWDALAGSTVHRACQELPELARILGYRVTICFNGIDITSDGTESSDGLYESWAKIMMGQDR